MSQKVNSLWFLDQPKSILKTKTPKVEELEDSEAKSQKEGEPEIMETGKESIKEDTVKKTHTVKFQDDNTSSTDSDSDTNFENLSSHLEISSYGKLNMFLINAIDKNRLVQFVKDPKFEMQNPDCDKMDIFTQRLKKEYDTVVQKLVDEQTKNDLWTQIQRLLTFLDYYYDSIPTLNSEETTAILYCLAKFTSDQGLAADTSSWIQKLKTQDYEESLYSHFTI